MCFYFSRSLWCCLIVNAATDMPDYDDRKELQGESKEQATHYSKTLDRNSLYGEGKVYINREIAHEKIVLIMQNDIEVF